MSEGATPGEGSGQEQSSGTAEGGSPSGSPDFATQLASLPEDLRSNPNLTKIESLEGLAKEYVNQSSMLGRKGIMAPNAEDPHDVHRFLKELGRPDEAGDYDLKDFTPPENVPWDTDNQSQLIKLCHECGITQGQLDKLLPGYAKLQENSFKNAMSISEGDFQTRIENLKTEFGGAFEAKVNLGSRAMAHLFGENAAGMLQARMADGTALGNNPEFIKAMIKVGDMVGEDRLAEAGQQGSGAQHSMTPQQALDEIRKLEGDTEFMKHFANPADAGYAEANAQHESLYAQAYPPQR